MRRFFQQSFLVMLFAALAGCSIQKRTLMPGYHLELTGTQNSVSKAVNPRDELDRLEWAVAGSLPNELPAAELTRPVLLHSKATHIAVTRSIPPKRVVVNPAPATLKEPTPWAEVYEEQKKLGNAALIAFGLAALLWATGAPAVAVTVAQVAGLIAFILNRRKRKEVIDIKEFHGFDVTEERRQFRTSNRLLGGAVFATVIAYIVLAILAVVAFIAFIESLFSW
jgi:hypothetical protein